MTTQAAQDKLERALPGVISRFGDSVSEIKHSWQGDLAQFSFRAKGFSINGELLVSDADVYWMCGFR